VNTVRRTHVLLNAVLQNNDLEGTR